MNKHKPLARINFKKTDEISDSEYCELFQTIKNRIQEAQTKAVFGVNKELILLYWHIGKKILEKQNKEGWGAKVIDNLSKDLVAAFPTMNGFSIRNLKYMRKFADEYPEISIVQEPLAQITWYHNITLLDKINSKETRLWYARQILQNGWSRNVLVHQIELDLFNRKGKALSNFDNTLPTPQSDLVKQTLKDPYIFDFLTMGEEHYERDIENQLTNHITKFLLELGAGFSYVGKQFHLEVGNDDFYLDLLFYHLKLRCYIVIELKAGDFKPEYAGKINFYLSAVDEILKHPSDNPTIGLILCKKNNKIIAEYALKDNSKPIGIAEYKIVESMPKNLKSSLPSIEEIEKELSNE